MNIKNDEKVMSLGYVKTSQEDVIFDNLPKLITPKVLAQCLGISVATVYDWNYRKQMRGIPPNLFLKVGGKLYVRTDVLNEWLSKCSQQKGDTYVSSKN